MVRFLLIIVACAVLAGARCNQAPPPTPGPIDDTEFCDEAEVRLSELGCLEGLGFVNGKVFDAELEEDLTFTQFCVDRQESGTRVFPKCLSLVTSCTDVEACWR